MKIHYSWIVYFTWHYFAMAWRERDHLETPATFQHIYRCLNLCNELKKKIIEWIKFQRKPQMTRIQFFNIRSFVQHLCSRCCFSAWSRPQFHQRCRRRTPLLLLHRQTNRQADASPGKIERDKKKKRLMSAHLRHEYIFIRTGILTHVHYKHLAARTSSPLYSAADLKTVLIFEAKPLPPHSGAQWGTARTLVCAQQAADFLRGSPSSPNI